MKRDLALEAIVAEAMNDGLAGPEPSDVAEDDPRLRQLRAMAERIKIAHFDAPPGVVDAAKALMPEPERRQIWARLVSGSLSLAGARAAEADSFQMVFHAEGHQARLMYVRQPKGWEIVGQGPAGWRVERQGRPVEVDAQGRFTLQVKTLSDSSLTLLDGGLEVLIPAADQAEENDSRRPD